ncbi:LOW QUALITY PROTEIN: putative transcriptional regulator, LysR family [Pseudomonas aeruginosa 39016]|nr:LOW QUALITY PROTEIN: putative transcriptional regulator, LysR family [Pseudomonas aeruginosa 39016]
MGKRESEANQPSRNRPAGHWLSACWREGIRIVRERGAGGGAILGEPLADTAQSRWRCQGGPAANRASTHWRNALAAAVA